MALAGLSARAGAACVIFLATLALASAAEVMQDRVEIIRAADHLLVDVYHVRGIGGARLKIPEGAWPETVLVRLHGFPELESFTATSSTAKLECVLARLENQHPIQMCRVGETRVDALGREPDFFEVKLPREIFPSDNEVVEIRWVDQLR
jgi:hypothetical protein